MEPVPSGKKEKAMNNASEINEEKKEDGENSIDFKTYFDEKSNILFYYPKNWFVQESIWDRDTKAVIVNSPEGFFWMVASYPGGTDPDVTAREVLATMKGEYDKLEEMPARRTIGSRTLHGYEMDFFFLDLVNSAVVLAFEEKGRTWVIFQQSTDQLALTGEPFSGEDVFEAITYSFLNHLAGK